MESFTIALFIPIDVGLSAKSAFDVFFLFLRFNGGLGGDYLLNIFARKGHGTVRAVSSHGLAGESNAPFRFNGGGHIFLAITEPSKTTNTKEMNFPIVSAVHTVLGLVGH
jgi:hypothetical protein